MSGQIVLVVMLSWWVKPALWLLSYYEALFNTGPHPAIIAWLAKHGAHTEGRITS